MTSDPTTALAITVTDNEAETVLRLQGRVTVDSSPDLRERLLELLNRPRPSTIAIEMSELTYLDFSGIATLIEALRMARRRNINLQLRGLHDGPHHLLEVAGLLRLFDTDGQKNNSSLSEVH